MIYNKIKSPFVRDEQTRKLTRKYINEEIEILANSEWIFTDKINGTNVRIYWDGYKIEYRGRNEKSVLSKEIIHKLDELFMEELFEQKFGETSVILYGEGFGGKIQNGTYEGKEDFILFDVKIGNMFLERDNLVGVGESLNIKVVPVIACTTIDDMIRSLKTEELVEGVVGVPKGNFLDRRGDRIIIKIKNRDFID